MYYCHRTIRLNPFTAYVAPFWINANFLLIHPICERLRNVIVYRYLIQSILIISTFTRTYHNSTTSYLSINSINVSHTRILTVLTIYMHNTYPSIGAIIWWIKVSTCHTYLLHRIVETVFVHCGQQYWSIMLQLPIVWSCLYQSIQLCVITFLHKLILSTYC